MPDLFNKINWVDVVFVILFFGMLFKGTKTGVGAQFLSLAGWLVMLYVSVSYYSFISEAIFGFMLQSWARPVSFLVIVMLILTVIKLLERVFSVVEGSELSLLEKIGGALVASVRAFILFGMIGFFLLTFPVDYIRNQSVRSSYSAINFIEFDSYLFRVIDGLVFSGSDERISSGGLEELMLQKNEISSD